MSAKLWVFNRRTVDDQVIYVRASSLDEAWRKARADEAEYTSDCKILSATYRRLKGEEE